MGKSSKQRSFSPREAGQGMVEYALILVLVAVVIIVALALFGSRVSSTYKTVVDGLQGGRSTQQVIADFQTRMLNYFNLHTHWQGSYSPYNFTDLGLNPADWSQPVNGLNFSPHIDNGPYRLGGEVGISNSNPAVKIFAKNLSGTTLRLNNAWAIWCPVNDPYCYMHTVAAGNEVDPASIYATGY
jgi:pilus assembly protein Flp/PilA